MKKIQKMNHVGIKISTVEPAAGVDIKCSNLQKKNVISVEIPL